MIEKVFLLHHTHVDFGYTARRDIVCNQLVAMVDQVIDLVDNSRHRPEAERFRWTHEVSWPVLEYLRRGGKRQERLFEQIRQGQVELTGLYVNPTDLFDRHTLEITSDYAYHLSQEHQLPLTSGMFNDCPGIAWTVPDILAARGVRYLVAGPDLIMSRPLEVERPFYWQGPHGGCVLTWLSDWRVNFYAEGLLYFKFHQDPVEASARLLDYIDRLECQNYRWRGLALQVAIDNGPPRPELMDFVAHFNAAQDRCRVTMSTCRDFLTFMEENHGQEFQVHQAAWPDWWANGHGSGAYESACSRRCKATLRRTAALAQQHHLRTDEALYNGVIDDLVMFDEHTWGDAQTAHAPWSLAVLEAWNQKREYVYRALLNAERYEEHFSSQLAKKGAIVVANPFDRPWHGVIEIKNDNTAKEAACLIDAAGHENVLGQLYRPGNGSNETYGCYCLQLNPGELRCFSKTEKSSPKAIRFAGMENDYFRMDYCEDSGSVLGLFDKSLQVELCEREARWGFAELIHDCVASGGRRAIYDGSLGATNPEATRPRPEFIYQAGHSHPQEIQLISGGVFNSLISKGRLPGVDFVREIRLFHDFKRIDVLLHLDKQIKADYESLYLAFPFQADSASVWVENAGTVYRAGVDQLPGSATDWHSVGEFAVVSGSNHSILFVPHDCPLIQIGDIHTGKWARRLDVCGGHLYSWIMNNMWYTNFPVTQGGQLNLKWSLTVEPGAYDLKAAERFSRDVCVGVLCKDQS